MKRLSILLLAAILLGSCHNKEATKAETAACMTACSLASPPDLKNRDNEKDERQHEPIVSKEELTVNYASMAAAERAEENQNTATITNRPETKEPSKIIRNATVNFQVECADSSHMRIARSLAAHNAYFGSDQRSQNGYEIQHTMLIRVPAAQFDLLLDQLMRESVFTYNKNITADDVTAEFVDIQIRLRSKKEVEKRYMELLSRAQKVSDILEVESNLRVIREEIESTEGRLKLLKDQVSYSTITLTITQKLKGEAQPELSFGYRLKTSMVNGWRSLESFTLDLASDWPYILMASPFIIWIVIRIRRRRQAKA